jgi:hypothetical protein
LSFTKAWPPEGGHAFVYVEIEIILIRISHVFVTVLEMPM